MKIEEAIYCLKAQSERYSEVCEECPMYGKTGVDHCCGQHYEVDCDRYDYCPNCGQHIDGGDEE